MFRNNRHFLIPYFIFLFGTGIFLLLSESERIHLTINKYHHPIADLFFRIVTYLGDGIIVGIVILVFLFIKVRHALLILISYALSALSTQLLKHLVFDGSPRPISFFKDTGHELRLVPGVEMNHWNSFPSGHSSAAFTLFFCLGLISNNPMVKLLMFFISLLAAFSRVYLSQHFLADIYVGSVIGITSAILIYLWMEKASHFQNKSWLEKPFFSSKRTK